MTNKQRKYLKNLAHDLQSVFQIGKNGLSDETIKGISQVIEKRELIKVSLLNNSEEDVKEIANKISKETESEIVYIIGRKIIFYKESKNSIISL